MDYDIGEAFAAIEDELISSMIRNFDRHKAEEDELGFNWSMWQAEQLKSLEVYKQTSAKVYKAQFKDINKKIEALIQMSRLEGGLEQEQEILKAIRKGLKAQKGPKGVMGQFFRLNDRKLEALMKATVNDVKKAETAILRMANDKYRRIIYNAQVFANTGAGTYEKAVDMATKDMLRAGLNCVEYSNGARHTLKDYADMAVRTACKRAYLTGEGEKRQEWGISTVIINKRGNPCPKCLPFVGKILIDDVWSGGKPEDGSYPLMSTAIAAGLYHPRCKDSHTTYFPGISTADDRWTKEELENVRQANKKEAEQQYARQQYEKCSRMSKYSLDEDNKKIYAARAADWKARAGEEIAKDALEKVGESSKIKSLDIDDFNMMASSNKIKDEVSAVIGNTIKEFEKSGGMYISEAHFGEFYNDETGKQALFQIFNGTNGLTQLNVNSRILGGKTVDEVNALLAGTKSNLPQTIEEAIAHECGHAKAYYGKSVKEIEAMNEELKNMGIEGISQDALRDGAECIAEVEVLIYRGSKVPKAAMDLYNKYVRGK